MAKKDGFVPLDEGTPFQPTEMFGRNFDQIKDTQAQKEHEQITGMNPATKLEFQEFQLNQDSAFKLPPKPTTTEQPSIPQEFHPSNEELGGFAETIDLQQPLQGQQQQYPDPNKKYHFWNIEYWAFLFNVDNQQVGQRLLRSLIPYPPKFFEVIGANPDIYAPFWIATTLVFLMAATGNFADYLAKALDNKEDKWEYQFQKVSFAAAAFYGYFLIVPLILFGVLRYFFKCSLKLLDALCIYGYSFTIYIPISILCVIPIDWVQWLLIGIAALISTGFLISNLYQVLSTVKNWWIILIVVGVLHIGFALTCRFYFFAF